MMVEWKPGSGDPEQLELERATSVRSHLQEVLASSAFKGGKRAQDFLQLVVEHALAGRYDNLRERMLGAEMFDRPIDYDTANDAVVRVKANEVRKRLTQHYQNLPFPAPVRIELQAGSYIPQFYFESSPLSTPLQTPSPASEDSFPTGPAQNAAVPSTRRRSPFLRTAIPVAVLTILIVGGWLAIRQWRQTSESGQIRSLAVLPLVNYSGDPHQDYFADGMTEELTAEVAQIPTLRVISRTSTMTYKGTKETVPQIAHELHVDGVVEGSVAREGHRIRIITQLIDARNDHHIWANTENRDLTSVLQLQSDVARAIADQIRIELTPQEQARFAHAQLVNPEAVDLYLQAVQRLNTGNPSNAIDLLKSAIAKEPNYAAAHASLADAYGWMGEAGWMPYDQAFALQKSEARKAIALDDSRPEPHLDLAMAAMNQDWDWQTQGKELKHAIEINPNASSVHWAYSNLLSRVGRPAEAIAEAKTAEQLDPISSRSFMNAAFVYYFARQYDRALEQMQQSAALHADPVEILFPLGAIYIEKGLYDQGIQEFLKLGDVPHALGHMGNAYARQGRLAEARAILPKLQAHIDKTGVGRYEIALVYAGLGDKDSAFQWLERAYQARDKGLTYLKADPCLDPLRSDPRFATLIKRVGFPNEPAAPEKAAQTTH
jgi:TolB-like protein/Tfp pilus assembly protein PilF